MIRGLLALIAVALAAACLPACAEASFGLSDFEVEAMAEGGGAATLAGSHPYQLTTSIGLNLAGESPGQVFSDGDLRDLQIELPPGLIENPDALTKCPLALFHTPRVSPFEESRSGESCPQASQIGIVTLHSSYGGGSTRTFGVFNLDPPPGVAAQFGFAPYGVPIAFTPQIRQAEGEYGITLQTRNFPQAFDVYGIELTIWGTPWGVSHNTQRGNCLNEVDPGFGYSKCQIGKPKDQPPLAYLTLPTTCAKPLTFTARATSWQQPGAVVATSTSGEEGGVAPDLSGCETLSFNPHAFGQLTDPRASSASGYEFGFSNPDEGLVVPRLRLSSQVKTAVVALPEGVTINPSVGAGLGACSPAQYAAEEASTPPGAGCPNASKIGDFGVETPLFEEPLEGSIFLAEPDNPVTASPGAENPFDSMLAVYLVARSPQRGILVKVAGKLEADTSTGRLTATFDDLPQIPYSKLKVNFREGQRAPLVSPPGCGPATTQIGLTPWLGSLGAFSQETLSQITVGIGGGPCPTGAAPPFAPGALAGTLNSNAGSYSPFYLHLTRTDAEQEITSYSTQLPPGLLGKIADVPFCPEAAIAAAKQATGTDERDHPSCPAASEIGHTVSGYGLGPVLAYAPGGLYLAGPYHGSPLSIVAVDSALVGPFDLGVVVVRSAIEINGFTAQVSIDSAGSDPIPHILDGIPLHLRDIRVYISRPGFTLNPTSCDPFSVTSTLTGSHAPFTNPEDITATAPVPFQASNCSALRFAPRMALKLRGGTRRGDFPALTAVVRPRPGNANIGRADVTLPHWAFLAQEHIDTVCTKPQLEADACPKGSVYGHASAITPLLAEPLRGPVYLGTGNGHQLPDMIAVLEGRGIRIVLDGEIGSDHGRLRARFDVIPDAPVTKFVMRLKGGRHGLIANEQNVCTSRETATARMAGQNNVGEVMHLPLTNSRCGKRGARK
jgi:hypothetical protein